MDKIKSGWVMDRKPFGDIARAVFLSCVDIERTFAIMPMDAMKGLRFNDNAAVLARVESYCTEIEFLGCPGPKIEEALIDAAKSDWWYQFEKDYGTDETEIAEDDDGE